MSVLPETPTKASPSPDQFLICTFVIRRNELFLISTFRLTSIFISTFVTTYYIITHSTRIAVDFPKKTSHASHRLVNPILRFGMKVDARASMIHSLFSIAREP